MTSFSMLRKNTFLGPDGFDPAVVLPAGLVYAGLAALGIIVSVALEQSPIAMSPWLPIEPETGTYASLLMGACLAGATIAFTRFVVGRVSWASALHGELRPVVRKLGGGAILALATAGGIAEEIVFRGALLQAIGGVLGLVISSIAFGALHQVRGAARWVWALWATVMGFLLGSVFALTGSLAGPVLAHVVVNAVNLRFLRDHEVHDPVARA